MKRFVLVGCSLLVTFVSPASADETNFELDNYTSATNGSIPPTGIGWENNPNVTKPIVAYPSDRNTTYRWNGCYIVPGRFNMAKGDALLSAAPKSVIYGLLSSLGQKWSHSGMARASTTLRHNTFDEGAVDTVDSSGVPQYAKATGSHSLRDGFPGMTSLTVEAATTWQEFNIANGTVLYSYSPTGFPDSAAMTSDRAAQRTAADAKMAAMKGYYRFYAYTNMAWKDPLTLASNDGNMCAGSVYWANALAGNDYWTSSAWVSYSADVRNGAAPTLYSSVKSHVKSETEWFQDVLLAFNSLGGTSLDDIATRVANQVVNCMAFNDCGNTGTRWKSGVGTGKTMAPQDLYNFAYDAAYTSALVGADIGFVYNGAKPIQVVGNYYCCPGGNDRSKYVTCSYSE